MSRPPAPKGARLPSARPLTRRVLDQDHLKTDFQGKPLDFHLTGGEASDSRQFETLLDIGPDIRPLAAITGRGYDAEANRKAARKRAICPESFRIA